MKKKQTKTVHLTAVKGGPDRLLETSGRDAETLCGGVVLEAKCIGRLDVVEMHLQARTTLLCSKCLMRLAGTLLEKPTYVYGVLPGVEADRMNAKGEEEE